MKKYILLGIPFIFYGPVLLPFSFPILLQVLLNIAIITVCMIFVLKRTRLQNVFDWFIGICFMVYFCLLYQNTIGFLFLFENVHYSLGNLKYIVHSVNLVPIKGIIDVIRYNPTATFQIIGNAVMLTPFAFTMLYFKWIKSNKQAILYSFLVSIGIELIQFLQSILTLVFDIGMGRSLDIDDVILNTISAIIGVGCYLLWVKIGNLFSQVRRKSERGHIF